MSQSDTSAADSLSVVLCYGLAMGVVSCGGWGEAGITNLYRSGLSGFSNRYIFKLSLSCE